MSERFIQGAVSGLVAGIVMGTISMTLYAFNICNLCIIAISGGIFSGQLMEGLNVYGLILAWLVHLTLSAALGILIAILLNYFGTAYHLLKGAGLLTLVYVANIGILAHLRGVFPDSQGFFELLLIFLYHILFGTLASFLLVKHTFKALA